MIFWQVAYASMAFVWRLFAGGFWPDPLDEYGQGSYEPEQLSWTAHGYETYECKVKIMYQADRQAKCSRFYNKTKKYVGVQEPELRSYIT